MSHSVTFITLQDPIKLILLLTHWGRVTHICVSNLTIIGSDNGLSPGRRQAIIRTDAGILLIRPLGTNFSEILIEILIFSFKKMRLKMSSAKRRPFCLGLNVLSESDVPNYPGRNTIYTHHSVIDLAGAGTGLWSMTALLLVITGYSWTIFLGLWSSVSLVFSSVPTKPWI